MPLTLSQEAREEFAKAFPGVVFLVEIHVSDTLVYRFVDGRPRNFSYPMSLEKVTPIKREFDPFKRQALPSQMAVRLQMDPLVEKMLTSNRLRGRKFVVKLGTANMLEANFAGHFLGLIEEARPVDNASRLLIKAVDAVGMSLDQKIVGIWHSLHPREMILDILTDKLKVPSALVNASTFAYDSDLRDSHYVISRGNVGAGTFVDLAVRTPTSAFAIIFEKLAPLMSGSVQVGEDGKFSYVKYDDTAAVTATIQDDDIGDIEQVDMIGDMVNRVTVHSHPDWFAGDTDWYQADGWRFAVTNGAIPFILEDTASQIDARFPGTTDTGVVERALAFDWVQGFGLVEESFSSSATSFNLILAMVHAMCGARRTLSPLTFNHTNAVASATRPVYLKVDQEIIKCDASLVSTSFTSGMMTYRADNGQTVQELLASRVTYTVASGGRAQFGTTAVAHPKNARAWDITIPVLKAQALIKRWSRGAPILRIKVKAPGLRYYGTQTGDLISVVTPRYRSFGKTSLGTETKWEVIEKEYDRDRHEMAFTLCWATETSPPPVTEARRGNGGMREVSLDQNYQIYNLGMSFGDVAIMHVVSGLGVSAVSGLVGRVAAGAASGLTIRQPLTADFDFTFAANSDTYVRFDLMSGGLGFAAVATGAAEPGPGQTEIRLAKVVTGASAITSITDQRPTRAISTGKLWTDGFEVLADNPSFEFGNIGWYKDDAAAAQFVIEANTPNSGSFSLAFPADGAANQVARNNQFVKAVAGDVFYAEAWARLASGASGTADLRITWWNGAKAYISDSVFSVGLTTAYQKISGTGTAPAGTAYASVSLLRFSGGSGKVHFDDVRFEHVKNTNLLAVGAVEYSRLDLRGQLGSGMIFNTNLHRKTP